MTDRDPLTVARDVLEREERLSAYSYSIPIEAQASWDATRSEQVKAAPDLARAVQRVTELADRLDNEADHEAAQGDTWDAQCIRSEARRIRDTLRAGFEGEAND